MPYIGGPKSLAEISLHHHASCLRNPETHKETLRRLSVQDLRKVVKFEERRKSVLGANLNPPNGGFGWVVVLFAFLLHFNCCGTLYTLSVYFPIFLETFNLSATNTSWISAIFFGCFFMCGPLAGYCVEKWGTRTTAFGGCLISACGLAIASFMRSYYLVVFFMAIFGGFGTGCAVLASVTATVRWFDTKRGIAVGLVASGSGFGTAVFGPLVTFLIDKYGWDGCMLIESALLLNGCFFAFFLRKVPIKRSKPKTRFPIADRNPASRNGDPGPDIPLMPLNDKGKFDAPPAPPLKRKSISEKAKSNVQVFRDWKFWIFAISQFMIFFSLNAPLVYLINRAVKDCQVPRMQASYLIAITGSHSTFGRLFFGAVAGKMKGYKFLPFALSMLLTGITGMLVVLNNSFWTTAVYCAVFGLGYGTMICLTSMVLVDYFGVSQIASVYGNLVFFRGLGFLAGPPIGGLIIAQSGGYHDVLWLLMGAIMTAGGLLTCLLPVIQKLLALKQRKPTTTL